MTRDEFVKANQYEMMGLLLAGYNVAKADANLGLFLRLIEDRIAAALGKCYDSLNPPKPLPPRGDGNHQQRSQR